MNARLHDADSLRAVSPASLSAYARLHGWEKTEPYGAHSDVYAAVGLPEVVLPRTQRIGDYVEVAARIIRTFAQTAGVEESDLLRELKAADRDAIRIRASGDDAATIDHGLALISGARNMIASTTRSLFEPRAAYQGRPAREVLEYLQRVRLADMAQGSFSVTLLPPAVPPAVDGVMEHLPDKGKIGARPHETSERALPMQVVEASEDEPIERQATRRLADALGATREAMAETIGGQSDAFGNAISKGASANLCKALADMTAPFETLDLSLTWALTRPAHTNQAIRFAFAKEESCILEEAARALRKRRIQADVRLTGSVEGLKRQGREVTLAAQLDGTRRLVVAHMTRADYERAIDIHKSNAKAELTGDLELLGSRISLLNPRIVV